MEGVVAPAPTGIVPLNDEVPPEAGHEPSQLFLEFEATQAEPPLEPIFLAKGGTLAGAAARGATDFAVSGSSVANSTKLSDQYATVVRIPLPEGLAAASTEKAFTVDIDNRSKLLVTGLRAGAAINGTVVETVSGQGAVYLANLFKRSAGNNAAIPLTYSNWMAHTAVVAATGMRIVDKDGRRYNLHFVENKQRDEVLKHAETFVGKWAEGAWQMRTGDDGLRYKYSPTLTKSIAKQPIGINDSGYDLVHNVLEMAMPFSWPTIDSLFANAIQTDLEFVEEDIEAFLCETKTAGMAAARHGRTIGASLSMLASLLISYRADGRTRITPEGSESVAAESWLRRPPGAAEGNDCDGGGILTTAMAHAIARAPKEVREQYQWVNAVRNILVPHYTVGVTVLGASGAEASGGGGAGTREQALAGHACTLMIPSISLLAAIEKGSSGNVGGAPVLAGDKHGPVAEARFAALFPADVLAEMPEEERANLKDWPTAKAYAHGLQAYGVEGTTPASPILYATGKAAADAEKNAKKDFAAFAKAAPNVGRSIKILYVGAADAANPHKFYHDFVEFNVPRGHALWSNEAVRGHGVAASQFVLGREPNRVTGAITQAGATPRNVATECYTAVPLVVANTETAQIIDYASEQADLDVMPPRPPGERLSKFQSEQLIKSLASLATLDDALKGDVSAEGHTVAYVLAYNTLINNPTGVEHFCTKLKAVASCGTVDALDVEGMAYDSEGKGAGKMVVINVLIPV